MTRKLLILPFLFITFLMESQNAVWTTNMTDAIALSKEKRKPLLILFTTSSASENLQNEVFETPEFEKWSRSKVILVKLDLSDFSASSESKEQNIKLKNAFSVINLPQVCFANAVVKNGKTMFDELGKLSYVPGGVKAWISESNLILEQE